MYAVGFKTRKKIRPQKQSNIETSGKLINERQFDRHQVTYPRLCHSGPGTDRTRVQVTQIG